MGKTTHLISIVKLKKHRVVLYYRNKEYGTGVSLNTNKDLSKQFNKGYLLKGFGGDFKVLNKKIYDKKHIIDSLIKKAEYNSKKALLEIDNYFRKEKDALKSLIIVSKTKISDAFETYIKIKKSKSKVIYKPESMQRYDTILKHLRKFEILQPNRIDDITLKWVNEICIYLAKEKNETFDVYDSMRELTYTTTKKTSMSNVSIKRFLQDFKSFLKAVEIDNSILKFPYKDLDDKIKNIPLPTKSNDTITALSTEQLNEIKEFKPNPKCDWQQKITDAYLFCCHTGLRWSDFRILDKKYIKNGVIKMNAKKTRGAFEVPLKSEAIEILERYDYTFVDKFPKNQSMNKNLKKVLKKMDTFQYDEIKYVYKLSEEPDIQEIKAWKFYSFHSSRRTFVSNCVRAGATLSQICKFTGWTDLSTLQHYMDVYGDSSDDFDIINRF